VTALDLDHRPVDLEVVELLGIDGADGRRLPGDAQVVDYPAGGFAGVVPAFEPGDGDGRGEFADVVELDDSPPPRRCNRLITAYVVRLTRRVTLWRVPSAATYLRVGMRRSKSILPVIA
jgi:hypothetical protein